MHFAIGILAHRAIGFAHKASGQHHRQFATPGFGQQGARVWCAVQGKRRLAVARIAANDVDDQYLNELLQTKMRALGLDEKRVTELVAAPLAPLRYSDDSLVVRRHRLDLQRQSVS